MPKKHWGYHFILDMSGLNDNIKDASVLKDFITVLVKSIKMKAIGEPVIKFLLEGQPNAGYSCTQLIETSSITFHLVEATHTAYLDVFSCKAFKQQSVIDLVIKYFAPKKIGHRFIYRDAERL